jgi:hypothetical protein
MQGGFRPHVWKCLPQALVEENRTNKKIIVRERDQKYHYLAMYQLMKDRKVERVRVDV